MTTISCWSKGNWRKISQKLDLYHKANTSFYHQDLAYYIKPLTHYIWDRPKLQVLQLLYLHVEFDKIIFEQAPFSK